MSSIVDCSDWTENLRQKSPIEFTDDQHLELPRDRVLILLDENKHSDVLWTPDKGEQQTGTVVKLGLPPLNKFGKPTGHDCEVGDRIVVSKYEGVQCKWNGKPALLLRETEILAVMG